MAVGWRLWQYGYGEWLANEEYYCTWEISVQRCLALAFRTFSERLWTNTMSFDFEAVRNARILNPLQQTHTQFFAYV